ncbi:uncharacterized protein LOC111701873 isoform X2 [Eurytemora carolleeae]|uniref:uncharacterized protein LOC111701873 isoform X2 n=1 Tax=Eurytemora carolleeae TaxID=1294199 RepID=UPI000C78EF5B|nr:uncharacterized protein LOC111701873 isoform X2 [Eurytemora carolleeae]|eukprot:XP_023329121.1 uncharacterized protein LOC111701873 isoform X2 [Eurytemora affinis]
MLKFGILCLVLLMLGSPIFSHPFTLEEENRMRADYVSVDESMNILKAALAGVVELRAAIKHYQESKVCWDFLPIIDKAADIETIICKLKNKEICTMSKMLKIHFIKMLKRCSPLLQTLPDDLPLRFRSSIGK